MRAPILRVSVSRACWHSVALVLISASSWRCCSRWASSLACARSSRGERSQQRGGGGGGPGRASHEACSTCRRRALAALSCSLCWPHSSRTGPRCAVLRLHPRTTPGLRTGRASHLHALLLFRLGPCLPLGALGLLGLLRDLGLPGLPLACLSGLPGCALPGGCSQLRSQGRLLWAALCALCLCRNRPSEISPAARTAGVLASRAASTLMKGPCLCCSAPAADGRRCSSARLPSKRGCAAALPHVPATCRSPPPRSTVNLMLTERRSTWWRLALHCCSWARAVPGRSAHSAGWIRWC